MKKLILLIAAIFTFMPAFAQMHDESLIEQYTTNARDSIIRSWAAYNHKAGYGVVSFRILKSGKLSDLEVIKSSSEAFSQEMIKAVESVFPMESFSQYSNLEYINMKINFGRQAPYPIIYVPDNFGKSEHEEPFLIKEQ